MNLKTIDFDEQFMIPRDAFREIATKYDALRAQIAEITPVIDALADMDNHMRHSDYDDQTADFHIFDCLTYGHLQTASAWIQKYRDTAVTEDAQAAVPEYPDPPYPHRTRVCAGCGTAVHEDDLADGSLCHICIKS